LVDQTLGDIADMFAAPAVTARSSTSAGGGRRRYPGDVTTHLDARRVGRGRTAGAFWRAAGDSAGGAAVAGSKTG
jgi:hypothetical protein